MFCFKFSVVYKSPKETWWLLKFRKGICLWWNSETGAVG